MQRQRVCIRVEELRKNGYSSLVEWKKNPTHLYICRRCHYVEGGDASIWGNPFRVTEQCPLDESLLLYEQHIRNGPLWHKLPSLAAITDLGCFCPPGANCHGEVLIRLLRECGV